MNTTRTSGRSATRVVAAAAAAALLTACSGITENLIERGLQQIEGVDAVDFDFDESGGSFTITSDEGEVFGIEVDDQGQSTITTNEGTMVTSVDGEIPPEVAAAIDLPATFEPGGSTTTTVDGGSAIMVIGEVTGTYGDIMDDLEASANQRWSNVERAEMAPGQMGAISAHEEDEERGVRINLIMEPDSETGMLQVMVVNP